MHFPARIEAKSSVMMGKACVKGTRIPVYLLLEKMAAGESFEDLLVAYPQLAIEDLRACLDFGNTCADAAIMLCRDKDEVCQKAEELGLVEHQKTW